MTSRSGALPVAEWEYSQIGKEFLAFVIGKERNHQYVFGKKVILRTAFVATLAVWLQDTLQAREMYADSQHFVKSLHRGLWAFSGRRRSRSHSCQSLPSCFRLLTQGNPEREREHLCFSASEFEKHNLEWLSTSDKPQAAPLAEDQSVPKQLNKAVVEIWAFPGRRRSRLHSCQSLPSYIKKGPVSLCNT